MHEYSVHKNTVRIYWNIFSLLRGKIDLECKGIVWQQYHFASKEKLEKSLNEIYISLD
jgi:hypothetical protein